MKIRIIILIMLSIFFAGESYAQMPDKQVNKVGYRKSVFGGVILHTQGLGLNLSYVKFKTFDKKRIFSVDFVSMKHPKEYKIFGAIDKNAKGFVYGKLNSAYVFRAGMGTRKIKYEKLRVGGAEINFNWLSGVSLGMAKPEYLEVSKYLGGQEYVIEVEKYDPEIHNLTNIYGRGPGSRGISEMKFYPGIFLKGSVNFEYSSERDRVRAIEVGAVVDAYPWRIPIMTTVKNSFIYPTFYISLYFGKKYI